MTGVHGQARPTAGAGGGAAGGSPLDALAEAIGIQGQTIQIPAIARIPARDVPLVVVLILAVVTLLFGWKILAVAAGELPPMPSNTYTELGHVFACVLAAAALHVFSGLSEQGAARGAGGGAAGGSAGRPGGGGGPRPGGRPA